MRRRAFLLAAAAGLMAGPGLRWEYYDHQPTDVVLLDYSSFMAYLKSAPRNRHERRVEESARRKR